MNKIINKGKKGGAFFNVLIIAAGIGLILVFGVIMAFSGMIIRWISDEVAPTFSTLGMAGDSNLSIIATYTVTPVQNVINSFSWMSGVAYVLSLLLMFGLAFVFRISGNKWMIVLFFVCMFLLLIVSIFISNIYQDFYEDTGDVGTGLHAMTLLSFMILNSPVMICIIGFLCGVIMFTGGEEESVY